MADKSGWMIKPVGPNSSSKCRLYCLKKTTKSDDFELLYCTALTCATIHDLELVQDRNFPCPTCPFRWSHLARMKHNHSCFQTGVAVAASESISPAATPAIKAICAALSAHKCSLSHLSKGLDDISRGFYYVKIRYKNISGWMMYPVDDVTEFYCS